MSVVVYVDSSAHKEKNLVGLGIALYEYQKKEEEITSGELIEGISEAHPGDRSSYGERLAILRGIYHAKKRGYKNIFLYNDHLSVVKKLNKILNGNRHNITTIEIEIANECKNEPIIIGYIPKKLNSKAHKLSRIAIKNQL